jgi:hypothetical protein
MGIMLFYQTSLIVVKPTKIEAAAYIFRHTIGEPIMTVNCNDNSECVDILLNKRS